MSTTVYPVSDTYNVAWADEAGGTVNIYTHIDETTASDADYIRPPENPSSSVYVCKLTGLGDPGSSSGHSLRYRYKRNDTGSATATLTVQLRQGYVNESGLGIPIAEWMHSGFTTIVQAEQTLSAAEADSITDYTDLFIRFVATANSVYYVDATGGDDDNDGLSAAAAWQTMTKVNTFDSYVSGSHVLFNRGETWAGIKLIVPVDGLTFGAYGTGARPIIDGSDTVDCILTNGKNNLRFENLDLTQGLDFGLAVQSSSNVAVVDVYGHDCGNDNLIFNNSSSCFVSGGAFYNAYTRVEDDRIITGIEIMDGAHDIVVDGAECYGNTGVASPAHYGAGIGIHSHSTPTVMPYNIEIKNCNIHDGGTNIFGIRIANAANVAMTDRNIQIHDNIIEGNTLDGIQVTITGAVPYPKGIDLYDNLFYGNARYQFSFKAVDSSIYRNDFISARNSGPQNNLDNCGDVTVYNNSYYCAATGFYGILSIDGAATINVKVKNNVFGESNTNPYFITTSTGTGTTGWECNYNLFQYTGTAARWTWNGSNVTYTNWLAAGNDANSPTRGDPLYNSPGTNDLTLQALSPAINAGVDVGLPYEGAAPDCGAHEYA